VVGKQEFFFVNLKNCKKNSTHRETKLMPKNHIPIMICDQEILQLLGSLHIAHTICNTKNE